MRFYNKLMESFFLVETWVLIYPQRGCFYFRRRLCTSATWLELVFSQYIDTLELIRDQISAIFGWTEGEEILYMQGQLKLTIRQYLINNFNRPDSKSKVLLASTGACSEGIHLVGASRVVLLDVVWKPFC
ncbi:unnamed protein product [Eruca vesicaria subsp. sativa]|uniref:Helicase C-terminal domain-containing protein n=1 Tax=Eruca vesicaria subsp. sativa TaxID=29727 RepID=A0ABC8KZ14_ERUVS|nr:unnamed protein product [Eruca vesicaria subsp. sativa]